jgi:hypothetical protein
MPAGGFPAKKSSVAASGDLPDRLTPRYRVQPLLKKYSDFPNTQISLYLSPSRPTEGRFAVVTNAGRDAVDADSACDEGVCRRTAKSCGPDASTPASSWRINPRNDGGKKADHRGATVFLKLDR